MNLATQLFKEHEYNTKRIARGSYNKKRGSRSKKCSLPHDNITKGEWKKLNGTIESFNLNRPMDKDTFSKMPIDLKREYVEKLTNEHRARLKDIAAMLGYSEGYFSNMLSTLYKGKGSPFGRGGKRTASPEWVEFINSVHEKKEEAVIEEVKEEPPVVEEKRDDKPMYIPECNYENIAFNAVGDPLIIFTQIAKIIEPGKKYRVYINLWQNEEKA